MNYVVGIAWYRDEFVYRRSLAVFTDSRNMPATYEDWQALVRRQCEEIKAAGNIAIRADMDPETFTDWCRKHGVIADAYGRMEFVKHAEIEYQKTGKGLVIDC